MMHFGRANTNHKYNLGNHRIESSEHEKDLGVIISDNLRPSAQCSAAAKKANAVLGQMSRAVSYRASITFLSLYKSHVRPLLEYAVQAWSPWTKQDMAILESVQKRAVQMISGITGSYEEKLRQLNLPSLEERRTRGDLVQVYKTIHEVDNVKPNTWFKLTESRGGATSTRHSTAPATIAKPNTVTMKEPRLNFWGTRTVEPWNLLPETTRLASSVTQFKLNYDQWTEVTKNQ